MLLIVDFLNHKRELGPQLNGFVVALRFLEKVVILDLLNCQAIIGVLVQSYAKNIA